jgi:alpha-galactosidase
MYALPDKKEALVFSYLIRKEIYGNDQALYVRGVDPEKMYTVKEVNKAPEGNSPLAALEGKKFSGEFLMTYGVRFAMHNEYQSVVFQLVAE